MKEWFLNLPFRGKLYVIGGFSIFLTIPVSKDNVYSYSMLSIGLFVVLGFVILLDVIQWRKKATLSSSEKQLSFKLMLGFLIVPVYYVWFLSVIFSIVMDYTYTTEYKTVGKLDSYWYSGGHRTWFGSCHYRSRIINNDGSSTFCVGHIQGHKELKSAISEQVFLVGRSGILGVVIDDVRFQ